MNKIRFYVCIALLFSGCTNKHLSNKNRGGQNLKIYCWCFDSEKYEEWEKNMWECLTNIQVPSSSIVRNDRLIDSIVNKIQIQQAIDIVSRYDSSQNKKYPIDSRMVFLLAYVDKSDTFIYVTDSILCRNNKELLYYGFSIIDSIKQLTYKKRITCTD